MAVIADVSITPIGEGTSVGKYVRRAVEVLEESGLKIEVCANSTTLEAESTKQVFDAVEKAKEELFGMGVKRLYIIIRIDERRDKAITIEGKKARAKG